MTETYEFVSSKHPDKQCDIIADTILDAYLAQDPESRVAVEVMGGHGAIYVMGEITSKGKVDIKKLVNHQVPDLKCEVNITEQSPEIKRGADVGAGDQGIMIGYACNETPNYMPYGYELARNLCKYLYERWENDGKVQITLKDNQPTIVVASWCGVNSIDLKRAVAKFLEPNAPLILANPAGDWNIGGFDADTGLTGRKIAIDNYGSRVAVGGGSFSGKDPTKVDRSAAYMARLAAVLLLNERSADECLVKVAYAIGRPKPVMLQAVFNGTEVANSLMFDFSPKAIIKRLDLQKPQYAKTAEWGAFGNGFNWL